MTSAERKRLKREKVATRIADACQVNAGEVTPHAITTLYVCSATPTLTLADRQRRVRPYPQVRGSQILSSSPTRGSCAPRNPAIALVPRFLGTSTFGDSRWCWSANQTEDVALEMKATLMGSRLHTGPHWQVNMPVRLLRTVPAIERVLQVPPPS